jgi:hypothetical protein
MTREQAEEELARRMWLTERAVVLQVLRDDHDERWARADLVRELFDLERSVLDGALARLEREGVLCAEGPVVRASSTARHLDALELIGV